MNKCGRHTVFAGSRKVVRPRIECTEPLRLWILEYNIKDTGKGCAVIKAPNAKKAESILKAEGTYNGSSNKYDIIRIEEIIDSNVEAMIAEQILVYYES